MRKTFFGEPMTDFEENLFLKKEVAELKVEIREKDYEIGLLKSDIEELKYNLQQKEDCKSHSNEIRGLKKKCFKFEKLYHEAMEKLNSSKPR